MKSVPPVVLLLTMIAFGAASVCQADDVYIVDASGIGPFLPDSCARLLWIADTVFYNLGGTDAAVKLLGVSNGTINSDAPTTLDIPAGHSASIRQIVGSRWQPATADGLWIYHLSVPPGIKFDSGLFPSRTSLSCIGPPGPDSQAFGKTRLPVFHGLVPAGQQQLLTGLTLGDFPSRINVAVYNAGSSIASATIEIHRACDGALMDSRTAVLEPNTIEQFGGFSIGEVPVACTLAFIGPNGLNRLAYAVVTVDQPSVSFASILANGQVPVSSIQVSGPMP